MGIGDDFSKKLHDEIHDRVHDQVRDSMRGVNWRGNRWDRRYGFSMGTAWGAILVAVGIVILLDHMGYIQGVDLWRYWPVLLILAGIRRILGSGQRAWGAFLIFLGVLFQLDQLGIAHVRWIDFWPIALIGGGVFLIWSSLEGRSLMRRANVDTADPRTTLNEQAVFGGVEKRLNSKEFRGGELNAVFGGIEIDLRDAEIADSEAVLVATAVFGGIEIRVPDTWFVATQGHGLFGAFTDNTHYHGMADPNSPPKKTLVVRGSSVFGGVEIRN